MTDNTKKIRRIVDRGLGPCLTNAGFHRHGPTFSRRYGEALHAIDFQLDRYNSNELGKFTLNIGVHFTSVAVLLLGKDPMPANPKVAWCLLTTRVGELMPAHKEHWWSVTSATDDDAVPKELATTCSLYVLPWLEQFKTLANVDWKSIRVRTFQNSHTAAAARLVLGDREGAAKCIAEELLRIKRYPADKKWKEEASGQTISWAFEHGIPTSGPS